MKMDNSASAIESAVLLEISENLKKRAEALHPSKVKDMKDTEGLFFDFTK